MKQEQANGRAHLARMRRAELDGLFADNDGELTPEQLVEFASDPKTALHSIFTWDDSVAAQRWREDEAASYMRAVVTLVRKPDGSNLSTRAYVSLSGDRGTNVYRTIAEVLDADALRAQLLQGALDEMQQFRRKYAVLTELTGLFGQIDILRRHSA